MSRPTVRTHSAPSTATLLSACRLCPRQCGIDRTAGALGTCRAGSRAEVYRDGPHFGEEPPVSGTHGSGTIFFSRCTLSCRYCQNYPWSQGGEGRHVDTPGLAAMMQKLVRAGCHNINLVSPTPWLPQIRDALTMCKDAGFALPVVYNTSGYERIEVLDGFAPLMDVYLADLRYAQSASAAAGSAAPDYVDRARTALAHMWRLTGPVVTDTSGMIVAGTICRILVLPGRANEAIDNLRWIADHIGTEIALSVMAQYTPAHRAVNDPVWGRRISRAEYEPVCTEVERLGFADGWVQDVAEDNDTALAGFAMTPGHAAVGHGAT